MHARRLGGGEDERRLNTARFKPDKGFGGAEGGSSGGANPRSGAVQFEKDAAEQDPFGLDAFMTELKGKDKDKDKRR